MIENLKIGCTVSKDQVMRILTEEDICADNVLDVIYYDEWIVEYAQDGTTMREAFESVNDALDRYYELKTQEEFDFMKDFLGSIRD